MCTRDWDLTCLVFVRRLRSLPHTELVIRLTKVSTKDNGSRTNGKAMESWYTIMVKSTKVNGPKVCEKAEGDSSTRMAVFMKESG